MASRKQRKEKKRKGRCEEKQKALLKILLTYSDNLSVLSRTNARIAS